MNLTFEGLEPDYTKRLAAWKPKLRSGQDNPNTVAKKLLENKQHFLELQSLCGVPALWTMPVFEREGPSFACYLGNGDPLDKPTTDVPEGRGPFATWEAGAMDSLQLDHVTNAGTWTWEMACFQWESWNGFGAREYHKRPTGYLWSGTNQYAGGKYISDGVWSRGTWDEQLGCVILAKAIADLDAEIAAGFVS